MKFKESYNFPGNKNFERVLLDLLNIKPDCSYENYVVYHFFYKALNMQNIPPFEEVFNNNSETYLIISISSLKCDAKNFQSSFHLA